MKTIGEQVKAFRDHMNWSVKRLAEEVGTSRQNIESMESKGGRTPRYLPQLARVMGVSVDDLMAGRYAPPGKNVVNIGTVGNQKTKPVELVIPQFNTGGSMGRGLLLRDQPGVIQGWTVSQEWVTKNIRSHSGAANLCIVTGFGDSMKGMFNSGDPIVVDTGIRVVDYDAVYFFRVGEEGFIKRLQRIPGEGIRVLSENKQYDAWTIKAGMDFEVFGRVVKAWQGEDF